MSVENLIKNDQNLDKLCIFVRFLNLHISCISNEIVLALDKKYNDFPDAACATRICQTGPYAIVKDVQSATLSPNKVKALYGKYR